MPLSNDFYKEELSGVIDVRRKTTRGTEKKTFHLHADMEMIYTLSDNMIYCTEEKRTPIPADTLVLINSLALHHIDYVKDSGYCDRYVVYFKPEQIAGLDSPETNLLGCFVPHGGDAVFLSVPAELKATLCWHLSEADLTCRQCKQPPEGDAEYDTSLRLLSLKLCLGRLLVIANSLYRKQSSIARTPKYAERSRLVFSVCEYIDKHCGEAMTMEGISRDFYTSKTQLYNVFKEITKMSVGEYIAMTRLTRAKDYLINTELSVEIISQMVGYSNIASFSRVFKSHMGVSPLQYRKRYRKQAVSNHG